MPFRQVVESEGHLIDSHIMEQIFDTVIAFDGRFEVETFHIGRTNGDPSRLRLKVEAPTEERMEQMLAHLLELGCSPGEGGDAELALAGRDRCAPRGFYSTTNHRTMIRLQGRWIEVANQRMDALIVVNGQRAECRRLRDLRAGEAVVVGMKGIRVIPESKERDRLHFAFMSNGISSERQVETAVRETAELLRRTLEQGKKVIIVAGPVVIHTGGGPALAQLVRNGCVQALLTEGDQRDLPRRWDPPGRRTRAAHQRRSVRVRQSRRALRPGGQPAR